MPASLSPTQLMPQTLVGFQQHKGNGMPIARESKEDAVVRLRDEPKCLREMQGWHGVAGNANCSLQYTLVGSQHCQLLLVPSTASGGRPHGRRRRPSLKGLWKATIQVVMPVFPTAALCSCMPGYWLLEGLLFSFRCRCPVQSNHYMFRAFFWQSRLREVYDPQHTSVVVWKDWVIF